MALFQRAGEHDSAGRETEAEPLYRAAIAAGLPDELQAQAVIQLASTIRNLDRPEESLQLLTAEFSGRPRDAWSDAADAFTALTLASLGRPTEGLALVLGALAPHLPRYQRSVTGYAQELTDGRR